MDFDSFSPTLQIKTRNYFLSRGRVSSERRGSSLLDLSLLGLLLLDTLGQQLSVLGSSVLLGLGVSELLGSETSLSLQSLRGNETLDLWSLGVGLVALGDLTSDDKLANVVLLGQTEELSNVVGSLWSQSLWNGLVGETLDFLLTLLKDDQTQDGQIRANNASTDGLSLTLTSSARSVAGVALGQQESDTGWVQNTLLHWETLLVVTAGDLEDVTLELVTNGVALDFLAHTLVVENSNTLFIVNFNQLLSAVGWVGDIELNNHSVSTPSSNPRIQINIPSCCAAVVDCRPNEALKEKVRLDWDSP